jgi:hypothetical protein
MARNTRITAVNGGKVKFRFIEFELDGGDDSIKESLKSISSAFLNGGNRSKSIKTLPELNSSTEAVDNSDDSQGEENAPDVQEMEASALRNASSRKPETTKVKVLDDVKLDDVKPTLKEFCAQKNPTSDQKKYLVIAFWFKEYKKIEEITVDHIHTAFRFMGWHTPRAAAQPLRDMKSKMGWLSKGKEKGTYTVNHVGENEVNGQT